MSNIELVRPIVKVGNSAGVILPRDWLHGTAKIELVKKPVNLEEEILKVLRDYLKEIKGIYLVGSYARNEQTDKSDVDLLVITNALTKRIESGFYNITMVKDEDIPSILENNIFPLLPMILEARPILNKELLDKYKYMKLTKKNLSFHLETTRSAMGIVRLLIKEAKEGKGKIRDGVTYSLVLRLRGVYIVDCLIKKKKWTNRGFLSLIKRIAGSLSAYQGYVRSKSDKTEKEELDSSEAERLYDYILSKLEEQEKWAKRER